MITGAVTVWYNGGQIPSSGSAFQWNWQGVVSPGGSCRGSCIEFGALYGLGRADYIGTSQSCSKYSVMTADMLFSLYSPGPLDEQSLDLVVSIPEQQARP